MRAKQQEPLDDLRDRANALLGDQGLRVYDLAEGLFATVYVQRVSGGVSVFGVGRAETGPQTSFFIPQRGNIQDIYTCGWELCVRSALELFMLLERNSPDTAQNTWRRFSERGTALTLIGASLDRIIDPGSAISQALFGNDTYLPTPDELGPLAQQIERTTIPALLPTTDVFLNQEDGDICVSCHIIPDCEAPGLLRFYLYAYSASTAEERIPVSFAGLLITLIDEDTGANFAPGEDRRNEFLEFAGVDPAGSYRFCADLKPAE